MTYFPTTRITLKNGKDVDAFGRLRTSSPFTLLDEMHQYSTGSLWETSITGSATVVHLISESSVRLSVTSEKDDRAVRQSHLYNTYAPGKSQQIVMSAVIGSGTLGIRKRFGYFDDNDGLFFEQSGS